MLCHQCGSPVDAMEGACPNCGAELRTTRRLKLSGSRGVRISQELKAIRLDQQLFPPGEEVAKRFVLGEMIGKGPFGEVYRATDQAIDAEVAVKILVSAVLPSPLDEERFLQATRAGRRLTQQNLVRLHDSGVHKGNPWVSMQLLEGLSLRKVLDLRQSKGETFALGELEPIVAQITLALQHVSRDFPHGDLKPENIVFLPELIKITDSFLLASLPANVIIPRLRENPYFAPELHTAVSEPTPRADVYSVGVIIGEMLFGPDYTPGSRSTGEFAAIDALIKRATAFDPSERYASVEALSEDLATVIDTGSLLSPSSAVATPPQSTPLPLVPPAPPLGLAPSSSVVEDEAATVEYSRDLDQRLQDDILTREVGRRLPPGTARTVTAAIPKPAGPIPAPRPVQSDAPVKIAGTVVAVVLLAMLVFTLQSGDEAPVEHIGQAPADLMKSASGPTPAQADETSPRPVAEAPKPEMTVVATAAGQEVWGAQSAAVTSSQATSTNDNATKSEADPPKASDRGARQDRPDTSGSTGAAATSKSAASEKVTGTDCPAGMRLVKSSKLGNFCLDTYEYPGAGATPKTSVSWFQAKKLCEAKDKRLCELAEWRSACGARYPYGSSHDPDKCNTADEDGFERSLAKAGEYKQCRSRSGAYDMVGNAHEWVKEQRIAGGGFESDEEVGSCRYSSPKSPASSAAYIGFRCCSDPN